MAKGIWRRFPYLDFTKLWMRFLSISTTLLWTPIRLKSYDRDGIEQYLPCPSCNHFSSQHIGYFFLLVGVDVQFSFHSSFPNAMPWEKMMTTLRFVVILDWDHAPELSTHWNTMVNVFFEAHIDVGFIIIKHYNLNLESSIFVRLKLTCPKWLDDHFDWCIKCFFTKNI
jgi:hypothetical protein